MDVLLDSCCSDTICLLLPSSVLVHKVLKLLMVPIMGIMLKVLVRQSSAPRKGTIVMPFPRHQSGTLWHSRTLQKHLKSLTTSVALVTTSKALVPSSVALVTTSVALVTTSKAPVTTSVALEISPRKSRQPIPL